MSSNVYWAGTRVNHSCFTKDTITKWPVVLRNSLNLAIKDLLKDYITVDIFDDNILGRDLLPSYFKFSFITIDTLIACKTIGTLLSYDSQNNCYFVYNCFLAHKEGNYPTVQMNIVYVTYCDR